MNPRRRFTVFSTDDISGVKNFIYVCSGCLCCVCGLSSVTTWFFLWCFNLWADVLRFAVDF